MIQIVNLFISSNSKNSGGSSQFMSFFLALVSGESFGFTKFESILAVYVGGGAGCQGERVARETNVKTYNSRR